jgi:hypothetical protein
MALTPEQEELVELVVGQAKRVTRESRILVQQVAQLRDSTAAATSTAEEAHETDERNSD